MFAMDWITSLISLLIGIMIFKYLDYKDVEKDWGPAEEAAAYLRAVRSLHSLRSVRRDPSGNVHVKTYRPQYLVMAGSAHKRRWLISFISKLYKVCIPLVRCSLQQPLS